jgi:hypothetical protein
MNVTDTVGLCVNLMIATEDKDFQAHNITYQLLMEALYWGVIIQFGLGRKYIFIFCFSVYIL